MAIPAELALGPMVPSGAMLKGLDTATFPSGKVVTFWAIFFQISLFFYDGSPYQSAIENG